MKTKTTKRRKVWVNELEGDLGSAVWHFHANARTAAMSNRAAGVESKSVAFIESRPGDVVLSREGVERVLAEIHRLMDSAEAWRDMTPLLRLLRGGR